MTRAHLHVRATEKYKNSLRLELERGRPFVKYPFNQCVVEKQRFSYEWGEVKAAPEIEITPYLCQVGLSPLPRRDCLLPGLFRDSRA
jgi:hypothetical protein